MIVESEKDFIAEPSGQEEDPQPSKKSSGTSGKILEIFIFNHSLHLYL